ncbi:uncharacterized protein LOC114371530 [Glycine soja]|uniref:uncharacterized protein n=1 Tax=Glycine max TaxID=3847 RepID=UPI0003DEA8A9|nr:uncharacterized protein LOC100780603 [Glycine max]XP_028184743.1 uncharacterized protein LOC114371530 [Glycine soja]|eukprot:XP_006589997.1 uncharacterized protein LOC100780603 [Glycine max]
MQCEFPDEDIMVVLQEEETPKEGKWIMLFDGASNVLGHEIGAILISPEKQYIPIITSLCFEYTSNVAKYEVCTLGLQATVESKVKKLKVYGDSTLVINQLNGEWETQDAKLIPYQTYIKELMKQFEEISFDHIIQENNQLVDALATLSFMFALSEDEDMPHTKIQCCGKPAYCHLVEEELDGKPWYYDIKKYIKSREYSPSDLENDKRTLRRLLMNFFLN